MVLESRVLDQMFKVLLPFCCLFGNRFLLIVDCLQYHICLKMGMKLILRLPF